MILRFRQLIFFTLLTIRSGNQQLLNFIRTERAAVYVSLSLITND